MSKTTAYNTEGTTITTAFLLHSNPQIEARRMAVPSRNKTIRGTPEGQGIKKQCCRQGKALRA